MVNDIIFNYMIDLKKKKVDKFERAATIRQYLIDNNLSIRALGRQLDIPKSTIEDWLLFDRIDQETYEEYISQGIKPVDIYWQLRKQKTEPDINIDVVEEELSKVITLLNAIRGGHKIKPKTTRTSAQLHEIRDLINRIELKMEKKQK